MKLLTQSSDDHFRKAGSRWLFGTSKVDKGQIPKNGHPSLASFKNPVVYRDDVQGPARGFRFLLDKTSIANNGRPLRTFPDKMSFLRTPCFLRGAALCPRYDKLR